ncbi:MULTISPECIES: condensation domain-containing protein [unclassified Streptomyces]|uniref:condensation domain-containing protein n=2 Tax=Streptomyces TaxID=1883 RepID=UPI0004C2AE0B|nr:MULTISPECIES: condensation domain-containing protein [unclassified Streptomyces]
MNHHGMKAVPFSGSGDWEGPATWGQQGFWDSLKRYDCTSWYRNVAPVWTVPEGWSLADVFQLLGSTVSRYEGLRTDVREGADGRLRQRVRGRGEFPVEIIEATDESDFAGHAARLRALPMIGNGKLPFAAAVVVEEGRPRQLIWAISHLAVDASSVRVLLSHLDEPRQGPPPQPKDQAEAEAGDRLAQAAERSTTAWLRALAGADLPFVARRPEPGAGGIIQETLTSRPAATRLEELTAVLGTDASAVLLAAVSVALGSHLGLRSLPLQVVTSNRHRSDTEDYLGVLAQLGPMTVDLNPDQRFGDAVGQVRRRSLRAYSSALWSPAALDSALRGTGRSADEVLGATCTFNDVRGGFPAVMDHPAQPDPGKDHAVRPLPWWPYQGGRCGIAVAGDQELLQFAVRADTAYVAPKLARSLLPAIDTVLRLAHERTDALVGELTATVAGELADR